MKNFKKVVFLLAAISLINPILVMAEENTEDVSNIEVQNVEEQVNYDELISLTNEEDTSVASIGDVKYDTLELAYKSAVSGDVIVLHSDATFNVGTINKTVTINGSGYTINITGQNTISNATLTIDNAIVNHAKESGWSMTMGATGELNLVNGTVYTFSKTGIYGSNGAKVVVDGSTLVAKDMSYTIFMGESFMNFYLYNGATMTVSDGSGNAFASCSVYVDNSTFTIKNFGNQGIVNGHFIVTNGSNVLIDNVNTGINLYDYNNFKIDGTSSVEFKDCGERAIMAQGNSNTLVESGATLYIHGCGYEFEGTDDSKYYAEKSAVTIGVYGYYSKYDYIYLYYGDSADIVNFEDGAKVSIVDNYVRAISNWGNTYLGNTTVITNNGKNNVENGGGIYNAGTLTIAAGALVYNNHASVAGDDIYSTGKFTNLLSNPTNKDYKLTLSEVESDLTLDDCEHTINGWYDDSADNRWNADDEETPIHVEKVKAGTYKEVLSIKAAHNRIIKVTVNYVDREGKELAESTEEYYYEDEEYTSEELEFDGYVLVEVEGEANGTVGSEDITITYIYEFVMGEGGEEEIPGLVQTGSEFDYSLMSSAAITLTLIGLVAYTKKRRD